MIVKERKEALCRWHKVNFMLSVLKIRLEEERIVTSSESVSVK